MMKNGYQIPNATPNARAKPGQDWKPRMSIGYDNEPTVTFLCEQCKREFDVEGTVERTDDEGGLEFIPSIDGTTKQVYCPNDFAWGFGEPPVHEISLGA